MNSTQAAIRSMNNLSLNLRTPNLSLITTNLAIMPTQRQIVAIQAMA